MALVRWDPLREFDQMQTRLNRLLGDAALQRAGGEGMSLSGWSPAVDVHETDDEYGKFLRRFMLPSNVDDSRLRAEFTDGVLQVHLPKAAVAKPKAIDVKVG